jgi:hypothetical protein
MCRARARINQSVQESCHWSSATPQQIPGQDLRFRACFVNRSERPNTTGPWRHHHHPAIHHAASSSRCILIARHRHRAALSIARHSHRKASSRGIVARHYPSRDIIARHHHRAVFSIAPHLHSAVFSIARHQHRAVFSSRIIIARHCHHTALSIARNHPSHGIIHRTASSSYGIIINKQQASFYRNHSPISDASPMSVGGTRGSARALIASAETAASTTRQTFSTAVRGDRGTDATTRTVIDSSAPADVLDTAGERSEELQRHATTLATPNLCAERNSAPKICGPADALPSTAPSATGAGPSVFKSSKSSGGVQDYALMRAVEKQRIEIAFPRRAHSNFLFVSKPMNLRDSTLMCRFPRRPSATISVTVVI